MESLYIAVDVGATNIRVALGDAEGRLYVKFREKTVRSGGRLSIAEQILEIIGKSVSPRMLENVNAIGIGSIGPLDLKRGRIVGTPNLPFDVVELVEPLKNRLRKPVYLVNDCVAGVMGEWVYGAGRGYRNVVYITISTGIGGGAIVDGHLLLGKDGNAHEVGHMVVDLEGIMECGCGCRGHWEAYCSGSKIPAYAEHLLSTMPVEEVRASSLYHHYVKGELTAEIIYRAAAEGDRIAMEIVEAIGKINAIGVANVVNVYDPELVTIGGAVALRNSSLVLQPIIKYVKKYVVNRLPKIMLTPLGEDIVLYGALAIAANPPRELLEAMGI